MKRVIQPLVIPLVQKIQLVKSTSLHEGGRKLTKDDINSVTLESIQGYLYLIGDFLKNCQSLKSRSPINHPYSNLFNEIWLFLTQIIGEFTNLDEIVEFASRIVKSSMRILGRQFDSYLMQFLQMVIQGYEVRYISKLNNLYYSKITCPALYTLQSSAQQTIISLASLKTSFKRLSTESASTL